MSSALQSCVVRSCFSAKQALPLNRGDRSLEHDERDLTDGSLVAPGENHHDGSPVHRDAPSLLRYKKFIVAMLTLAGEKDRLAERKRRLWTCGRPAR